MRDKAQHHADKMARRVVIRRALQQIKLTRGCADCGYRRYHEALDFDHVRGKKEFALSYALNYSLKRALREVAKCDVVCATCHRERTARRRPNDRRSDRL